MAWRQCPKCGKKLFEWPNRPLPLDGYCGPCYEAITGRCAECEGTGQINRAHLGTVECPRCEGSGQAKLPHTPTKNDDE